MKLVWLTWWGILLVDLALFVAFVFIGVLPPGQYNDFLCLYPTVFCGGVAFIVPFVRWWYNQRMWKLENKVDKLERELAEKVNQRVNLENRLKQDVQAARASATFTVKIDDQAGGEWSEWRSAVSGEKLKKIFERIAESGARDDAFTVRGLMGLELTREQAIKLRDEMLGAGLLRWRFDGKPNKGMVMTPACKQFLSDTRDRKRGKLPTRAALPAAQPVETQPGGQAAPGGDALAHVAGHVPTGSGAAPGGDVLPNVAGGAPPSGPVGACL